MHSALPLAQLVVATDADHHHHQQQQETLRAELGAVPYAMGSIACRLRRAKAKEETQKVIKS